MNEWRCESEEMRGAEGAIVNGNESREDEGIGMI